MHKTVKVLFLLFIVNGCAAATMEDKAFWSNLYEYQLPGEQEIKTNSISKAYPKPVEEVWAAAFAIIHQQGLVLRCDKKSRSIAYFKDSSSSSPTTIFIESVGEGRSEVYLSGEEKESQFLEKLATQLLLKDELRSRWLKLSSESNGTSIERRLR